jgi:hypothetical protein
MKDGEHHSLRCASVFAYDDVFAPGLPVPEYMASGDGVFVDFRVRTARSLNEVGRDWYLHALLFSYTNKQLHHWEYVESPSHWRGWPVGNWDKWEPL